LNLIILIVYGENKAYPVKYINSCQIDLDNNDKEDIVLQIEKQNNQWETIVLMNYGNKYKTYTISKNKNMYLECYYGHEFFGYDKNLNRKSMHRTNGKYIKLQLPESSSVVYFWNDSKKEFIKIWTSK
jgi:hypothetical protein